VDLDLVARREIGGGGSCRIQQERELLEGAPVVIGLLPGRGLSSSVGSGSW